MMFDKEMPLKVLVLRIVESRDGGGEVIAGVATCLNQQDAVASEGEVASDNPSTRTTAHHDIIIYGAVMIGRRDAV